MKALLIVLFFLSGLCALIYQIVWMRMLTLVFGVTSFAVATVLSSFMAGLALGSYYGGRYVDRRNNALISFSLLQFGIGVFALVFPFLFEILTDIYVGLYRQWPSGLYVSSLIRFFLAFSVLLIPTTMMGATLPVLAKFFVRDKKDLGFNIGILYSANNWGAVIGGLAAGFVLIEALGVRDTSYLAAALSLSIGAVTLRLHGRSAWEASHPAPSTAPVVEPERGEQYPSYMLHVVLWVFGVEGFTSLAYEVVWTRILASSLIASTTYAYSLVVATFIAGLALGSLLIGRLVDRQHDLLLWLGGIEVAIGLAAVLLLPLFQSSETFSRILGRPGSWAAWTGATAAWLGILMLVPTTLMGATFPLVGKIYTVNFQELGRCIGKIGCLDTAGSIFGAFAGGFVLIPLLGMQMSVLVLAMVNVSIGMAVVLFHPRFAWSRKAIAAVLLAAIASATYLLSPHDVIFRPWFLGEGDISRCQGWYIVDCHEGIGSTVTVSRTFTDDSKLLQVDGADVAGTGRPLETTQITQAHLPLLIYEAQNGTKPKRALTIGLGSGGTSWSLSLYDLSEIHCVELLDGVLKMARKHFRDLNHDVFDDPRYSVFIQDARAFILAADRKYDVIMDDSVHPGFQGNASLYSRDFFRQCRDRLTEEGVMSVWMPVFLISPEDLKMIFRAFCEVFPHATLWRANNDLNKHMVLVGTRKPLRLDFEAFRRRMNVPAIRNDLARVGLEDPFTMLSSFLLDEDALEEYCRRSPVHCDDRPYLEFSCARSFRRYWGRDMWMDRVMELGRFGCSILPYLTNLGETEEEISQNIERINVECKVAHHVNEGYLAVTRGDYGQAVREAERALKLNPSSRNARLLLSRSKNYAAIQYQREGRTSLAEREFMDILSSDPGFFYAQEGLASCYWRQGRIREAIRMLESALRMEPWHASRRYWLAGFYARVGMVKEAREQLRKVLEAFPGEPRTIQKLKESEEFDI